MKGYTVSSIGEGLWLLRESSMSIYVVAGRERVAVIDSGYGAQNLREVVATLSPLPQLVLLTHCHTDHIYGAYHYPEAYLPRADLPLMARYGLAEKQSDRAGLQEEMEMTDAEMDAWMALPEPRMLPLDAGTRFDLGGRHLLTVDLAGHTAGSVGFLLEEERILFSGDGVTRCLWMHLCESAPLAMARRSLSALPKNAFDRIYMGHDAQPAPADFLDALLGLMDEALAQPGGEAMEDEEGKAWLMGEPGMQLIIPRE